MCTALLLLSSAARSSRQPSPRLTGPLPRALARTCSSCCTLGMRVEPPTSTTSWIVPLSILESLSTCAGHGRGHGGGDAGGDGGNKAQKATLRLQAAKFGARCACTAGAAQLKPACRSAPAAHCCRRSWPPTAAAAAVPSPHSAAQRSAYPLHRLHALAEQVHVELLEAGAGDGRVEVDALVQRVNLQAGLRGVGRWVGARVQVRVTDVLRSGLDAGQG